MPTPEPGGPTGRRHAPTARPAQDGPGEPGRPRHPRRCAEGAQRRPTERKGGGQPPGVRPPNQTGAWAPPGACFATCARQRSKTWARDKDARCKALIPRGLRTASCARTVGGAAAPRGTPGKREPRRDCARHEATIRCIRYCGPNSGRDQTDRTRPPDRAERKRGREGPETTPP
jgi:hypothetical protein